MKLWVPLLMSLSIHLGIGWWLLMPRHNESPVAPSVRDVIVLRMVPKNPFAPEAPSIDPVESTAPDTASPAEPQSPPSPPFTSLVEVPIVKDPPPAPDTPPTIRIPSVLSLRQVVEDTVNQQEQQNPGFNCSPVQLENDMLDCNNRIDQRFENAGNPVVELFKRDEAPSRLENAARMSVAGSKEIGANLRAAGISDAYIDRLMNQLESIAREYAAPQNAKTEILRNEMFRNDPVWQQRQRAMNPR